MTLKLVSERQAITSPSRKLGKVQFHDLRFSPNIKLVKPRTMRWAGYLAHMVEKRNTYEVLVEKPVGKRQLGKARRRWENNVHMNLREIE